MAANRDYLPTFIEDSSCITTAGNLVEIAITTIATMVIAITSYFVDN